MLDFIEQKWDICSHLTIYLDFKYTRNAFMVHLQLRKRVWWLQMAFFVAKGANNALSNPLAGS